MTSSNARDSDSFNPNASTPQTLLQFIRCFIITDDFTDVTEQSNILRYRIMLR